MFDLTLYQAYRWIILNNLLAKRDLVYIYVWNFKIQPIARVPAVSDQFWLYKYFSVPNMKTNFDMCNSNFMSDYLRIALYLSALIMNFSVWGGSVFVAVWHFHETPKKLKKSRTEFVIFHFKSVSTKSPNIISLPNSQKSQAKKWILDSRNGILEKYNVYKIKFLCID